MQSEKLIILLIITLFTTVFFSSLLLLMAGTKAAIMGGLLIPALVFSYCFPRWSILVFLIYLPLGGTITYAIAGVFKPIGGEVTYTRSYPLFHLAKDAFYFPAFFALVIGHQVWPKLRPKIKPLLIVLGIFVLLCLLTFFLVNLPQQLAGSDDKVLLMGIIGLKIWLGYIPLILCGYYWINSQKNLILLNRIFVILILISSIFCLIQYLLLINGICAGNIDLPEPANTKATLQAQCFVGGSLLYNPPQDLIRLPGTFVSPWQWSWFLVSSSFITYGAMLSEPSRVWQGISFSSIITVLIAALISGQRTALLLVPLIYVILLLITENRKKILLLKLGLIFGLTIIITFQLLSFGEIIGDFIDRWKYSPPQEFMVNQFQWLASDRLKWLGHGLGTTASAARSLGTIQLIEVFPVKVIYEIGILGFLGFLAVVTTLTILTFKAYRSLKTPALSRLGLCLWLFILFISYNPHYYPLAVDPVAVYYWFVAGMLLKLPELEEENLI
ncbi:hypothetical protein VB715_00950 [Crocosphaera sp. UHCC 0190]|uniref:hypothetical protein n=1 Tax=Crocosphaera sp. UHCC 0190 TaxID=3110246 RepID=UPI002B218046|nr:hypothetical protein [Crocosphaera sp. UHCC 0190]MEA5508322.1 hypothetical protein [Crocosphaera sp. UHCC 0190]